MTVLLDPDVAPHQPERSTSQANGDPDGGNVGLTFRSGANERIQNRMMMTVQRLAKFAYDLLKDLF